MIRARIAYDNYECSLCSGVIAPGHVYHEDIHRHNSTRFAHIRTCAGCHNERVGLPPIHTCLEADDAFWGWMIDHGHSAENSPYGLKARRDQWVSMLARRRKRRTERYSAPTGSHSYPGTTDAANIFTSDCSHGCGAWMGPTRSGGPKGVDPFGACPNAPEVMT